MRPQFLIKTSTDNQTYFVLVAPNGEIILTSELYRSLQSCEKGIESVIANAVRADIVLDIEVDPLSGTPDGIAQ